jgi:hypothetical protein
VSFLSDLASAFTGSSARKDIAKGKAEATGALNTGKTEGIGYYEQGIEGLDPYAAGGREGFEAYLASLGLRGDDARKAVQDRYFTDPVQNALMERIQRGNNRSFGAVGMGNSGKATQSLTNALLGQWGQYQDRLKGVGEGGAGAAAGQGTLRAGQGDIAFGTGQQIAGVNIGAANAIAQSRAIPINNLLKMFEVGTKGATARVSGPGGGG